MKLKGRVLPEGTHGNLVQAGVRGIQEAVFNLRPGGFVRHKAGQVRGKRTACRRNTMCADPPEGRNWGFTGNFT